MSRIVAIFGATGQQGGSVINHILNDPQLSQGYKIRAITRDPMSHKAQQLAAMNVEVVRGDVSDRESLNTALTGVHTAFLVTVPDFSPHALQVEFDAAKNVADAAVEKRVQYIIFSTLPSVSRISRGKYTKVASFDAKAKAEAYIRSLPIQSSFYSPGSFMENYITATLLRRASDGSNTFVMNMHISPRTRIPLIEAAGDTGKFVGSILQNPHEYSGKTTHGAERMYDLEEIAREIGKATGEEVAYRQISEEEYKASIPFAADVVAEAMSYFEEFGYYGADTEGLVTSGSVSSDGKLTSFGEFLAKHQPKLL